MPSTSARIRSKCKQLADLLIRKNASYGDSALHPLSIFGDGDPIKSLCARIDDKLARVKHQPGAFGENELLDLTGYLILLQLALEDQGSGIRNVIVLNETKSRKYKKMKEQNSAGSLHRKSLSCSSLGPSLLIR